MLFVNLVNVGFFIAGGLFGFMVAIILEVSRDE